ncbi:flagellar hook-length control protein FliK [Dasania sp. GY-MA-18]|uniref:Flagellar hook-length control protein FliK n=1 Tax=Dasania phycosphaerae TaxID=2950436 RepID=A0A9J6RHH4_9GAMM|nr:MULTISPECIES: flagellar hook-length control protein FliK [Dasania]MCR8921690.1 flagellar hook-length control protein FliK [Dasania sp. GY-MA-18]MCZ0864118.1 flagellar hook-length control protein FliK [Dasania phycosphaerae]MCZ0867846.1 flagellar hook-length control protein FliK [Dasania phycosphaerae]
MSLLSNHLLNSTVSLKSASLSQSSLFKPGVIEAVVLSNSPLLENGKASSEQYQIRLQPQANNNGNNSPNNSKGEQPSANNSANSNLLNNKPLEIISKLPLIVGSKIQLQITSDNSAKIISISPQLAQPAATAKTTTNPASNTPPAASAEPAQQIIDKALRSALPQQQALKNSVALLQQLSLASDSPLPPALKQSIKSLLATIPTAQQAQDPKQLKRALLNSGPFLESKLKRLVTDHYNRSLQQRKLSPEQRAQLPSEQQYQKRDGAIIQADSKASSQQLIRQIEQLLGRPLLSATNSKPKTSSPEHETATKPLLDASLLKNPELSAAAKTSVSNSKENLDIVLQQLGRQLLASLAKTQLNQLDSLSQRSSNSAEPSTNTNAWTLEIPITQGKQVDNVEIKIQQQDSSDKQQSGRKQWQVMLNFDLHKLGKMSVELLVIGQSVSATVWSELEAAHLEVKKEIDSFRQGLEKIGVNVTKVDCKIGLPKKQLYPLQPLVDVRT